MQNNCAVKVKVHFVSAPIKSNSVKAAIPKARSVNKIIFALLRNQIVVKDLNLILVSARLFDAMKKPNLRAVSRRGVGGAIWLESVICDQLDDG